MLRSVIGLLLGCAVLQPARPPKPGVKTPGVKIPIERLKPDAVFPYPGSPDWIAVDESGRDEIYVRPLLSNDYRTGPRQDRHVATNRHGAKTGQKS